MVSANVRLAEASATFVPELMSERRVLEAERSGMTSRRPSGPAGKLATVLLSATVALEILAIAARMEAPSASTVVAKSPSGMRRRSILVGVDNQLSQSSKRCCG